MKDYLIAAIIIIMIIGYMVAMIISGYVAGHFINKFW